MIKEINWYTDGVEMPSLDFDLMSQWLEEVSKSHNKILGKLTYIFCNDEKILEVNKEFLQHDYYTDIITFDYTRGRMVSGDIYISLDTVRSNAESLNELYNNELHRVIVHGLLHLCGINDKGIGEREIMESYENKALDMLSELEKESENRI